MSSPQVLSSTSPSCVQCAPYEERYMELIRIILWRTTPKLYNLASDELCNLLYDLCTNYDSNVTKKVEILIEWLFKLNCSAEDKNIYNFDQESRFVNTIALIFNNLHAEFEHINISEQLTQKVFETCWHYISTFSKLDPLKLAFDSLLCALCSIKPEFYDEILIKAKVSSENSNKSDLTDDQKLNLLLEQPCYMSTIAVASQSTVGIDKLTNSGIPKILVNALLKYVNVLQEHIKSVPENFDIEAPSTSKAAMNVSSYLMKSRKMEQKSNIFSESSKKMCLESCEFVPQILNFLTECSSEGSMRDWLGSEQACFFWKPLLELLCYYGYKISALLGQQENTSNRVESATIQFFACITSCHPKNQNVLINTLLSLIRPTTLAETSQNDINSSKIPSKTIISGFIRQMIIDVFLSSETIFVSLRVEQILLRAPSKYSRGELMKHYNKRHLLIPASLDSRFTDIHDYFHKDYKHISEVYKKFAGAKTKLSDNIAMHIAKIFNVEEVYNYPLNKIVHPDYSDLQIERKSTISQLLAVLQSKGCSISAPYIILTGGRKEYRLPNNFNDTEIIKIINEEPLPSILQRFARHGGLSFMLQHLPKTCAYYTQGNQGIKVTSLLPECSFKAFQIYSRLPGFLDILLQDETTDRLFLRLVLGETTDGENTDITNLNLETPPHTLPFKALYKLLDSSLRTTADGVNLRQKSLEMGVVHLLFETINISYKSKGVESEEIKLYWPKGTGYATGSIDLSSTIIYKDANLVTAVLLALSSYINPGDKIPAALLRDEIICFHEICDNFEELPPLFVMLLEDSLLISTLCAYLANNYFENIARNIPLYRAVLQLLRAMLFSKELFGLLQNINAASNQNSFSIVDLVFKMKIQVGTYLECQLCNNIPKLKNSVLTKFSEANREEITLFLSDLFDTALLMQKSKKDKRKDSVQTQIHEHEETVEALLNQKAIETEKNREGNEQQSEDLVCKHQLWNMDPPKQIKTLEDHYLEVMKKLQFNAYDITVEDNSNEKSFGHRFTVPYHFQSNVNMSINPSNCLRTRRLIQELNILSTSLPLSYGSSIFIRYDADRLDIMKVLITGPADTPYSNGCFEFDVYFPPEYPLVPMLVNFQTTGRNTVRFNPNFYTGGKVCLSVLNTWHGRPEEMWNAAKSSLLQVLVSIQSLILVPEPYFNEPGFESERLLQRGINLSRDYNSKIYLECIHWAMLEQIWNPNPCFKEVIHTHFWLKRFDICTQIENWIKNIRICNDFTKSDMKKMWEYYVELRSALGQLNTPPGLEKLDTYFHSSISPPSTIDCTCDDSFPIFESEALSSSSSKSSAQTDGISRLSSKLLDLKNDFLKATTSKQTTTTTTAAGDDSKVEATHSGLNSDKISKN